MGKRRHNPVRTCVACRQEAGKRELIRLVRDPLSGEVRIDEIGRAPGRGAYLHRDPACIAEARKRGSVARSLKAAVPEDLWGRL